MNMLQMVQSESATTSTERAYDKWFKKLVAIYPDADSDKAWDLFYDGCDVEDAKLQIDTDGNYPEGDK